MSKTEIIELVRVIVVIAMVVYAALLATPPGRLPLALRGLAKMLGKSAVLPNTPVTGVSKLKKFFAFLLVIIAFIIAKL